MSPALRNPASSVGYCDISEWHVCSVRANTCFNVALSRKVLGLTKPKGMNRNPSAILLHNGVNSIITAPLQDSFVIK